MESNNRQTQNDLIENALRTADALEKIGAKGSSMFNFNKQGQEQNQAQGQDPQFQMPKVEMPNLNSPYQQNKPDLDPQQYYERVNQEQKKLQEYHKTVMQINGMLTDMQQQFFQQVQKVQNQLNEILKNFFQT